jgi:hypothetical protein
MRILDLSFSNPKILDYFEGVSDTPPIGELLYVHTHFVENNFLSDLEVMILMAGEALDKNKKKAGVGIRMKAATDRLAPMIHDIREETAPEILGYLKQLYGYCKVLLK